MHVAADNQLGYSKKTRAGRGEIAGGRNGALRAARGSAAAEQAQPARLGQPTA